MSRFGRVDADDHLDRYYTPAWATRALLERIDVEGLGVSEPCAGDLHIHQVLCEYAPEWVNLTDVYPQYSDVEFCDATDPGMTYMMHGDSDIVITNPPYNADTGSASDVISTLLEALDCDVWALLRLSFLEPCGDRFELLERMDRTIVLPRVHYTGPAVSESGSNPETSVWCGWLQDPWYERNIEFVSKAERDRLKGQTDLLSE